MLACPPEPTGFVALCDVPMFCASAAWPALPARPGSPAPSLLVGCRSRRAVPSRRSLPRRARLRARRASSARFSRIFAAWRASACSRPRSMWPPTARTCSISARAAELTSEGIRRRFAGRARTAPHSVMLVEAALEPGVLLHQRQQVVPAQPGQDVGGLERQRPDRQVQDRDGDQPGDEPDVLVGEPGRPVVHLRGRVLDLVLHPRREGHHHQRCPGWSARTGCLCRRPSAARSWSPAGGSAAA